MIKAVLFDFDGVLTLDETGTESICKYISSVTGIDRSIFEKEYRKHNEELLLGELEHEEMWTELCEEIAQDIDIKILYDSFINTPINFEMFELVYALKHNKIKIGMVTDNKADRIKTIVDHHQWIDIFDGIAISAEVGSGKSEINIFNEIFQMLDVNPNECIFIDNSEANLIVPKRLKVTTLFFDHKKNDIVTLRKELLEAGVETLSLSK